MPQFTDYISHGTTEGRVLFGEVILVLMPAPKPAEEEDTDEWLPDAHLLLRDRDLARHLSGRDRTHLEKP